MLPDAVHFRIAWLHFLEDVSHAHEQEYKLLDFMILSGFCRLCPFGQQEAFPLAASEQQIGLFGDFAPKIQSVKQLHGNSCQHLAVFHPNKLGALQVDMQLISGVVQCPLVPTCIPSISF